MHFLRIVLGKRIERRLPQLRGRFGHQTHSSGRQAGRIPRIDRACLQAWELCRAHSPLISIPAPWLPCRVSPAQYQAKSHPGVQMAAPRTSQTVPMNFAASFLVNGMAASLFFYVISRKPVQKHGPF
jgi:hypothetical protein